MIKKATFIWIWISLTGLAFIITNSIANQSMENTEMKCPRSGKMCESNCLKNLSDADRQAVLEKRKQYFEEVEPLEKKLMKSMADLKDELSKNAPDKKIAHRLQKEISSKKAELDIKHIDFILEIKKINPDIQCRNMMGKCQMKEGMMNSGNNCPMKGVEMTPPPGCPAHKKQM